MHNWFKISGLMFRVKKIIFLFSIFILHFSAKAQFVNAVGISGGATWCKQIWKAPEGIIIPANDRILRMNGSIILEFFNNDNIHWVSELQYNMKGTKFVDIKQKNDYLCFNNFLKIQGEIFQGFPYFLIGPRVEYLLSSFPVKGYTSLHFSWSAGVGFEFINFSEPRIFTEFHYNPDFNNAYSLNGISAKNNSLELRVGLKYHFGNKLEDCPKVRK